MDLVIDVGNTAIKAGLFKGHLIEESVTFTPDDQPGMLSWLDGLSIDKILVSAVAALPPDLEAYLLRTGTFFMLGSETPVPVQNAYLSPETLGNDRLANACGAVSLYPNKACLIVDMGTCLKFDFVDHNGIYRGGSIAPGLHMRYRALHAFTARLPLIEPSVDPELIGSTSGKSISSGVQNGMLFEMEGMMAAYREMEQDLRILVTGGDAGFFIKRFKSGIFAVPSLTLIGLHAILEHQKLHEK